MNNKTKNKIKKLFSLKNIFASLVVFSILITGFSFDIKKVEALGTDFASHSYQPSGVSAQGCGSSDDPYQAFMGADSYFDNWCGVGSGYVQKLFTSQQTIGHVAATVCSDNRFIPPPNFYVQLMNTSDQWVTVATGNGTDYVSCHTVDTDITSMVAKGIKINSYNTHGWGSISNIRAHEYEPVTPVLINPTSSSVASSTAVLGANVSAVGGSSLTARGIVYGTSPNPTGNVTVASGTTTGVYTVNVSGLSPDTLYYYRGYATNSEGTGYSVDATFTTAGNTTATLSAPNCNIAVGYNSCNTNLTWNTIDPIVSNASAKVLVVGGGGGGANTGSGGGGGGVVYNDNFTLSATSYSITVGTGGTGGNPTGNPSAGYKGNNSVFSNITAEGGGQGKTHGDCAAGGSGGSGGGGAISTTCTSAGGAGSQGYAGGNGYYETGWNGNSGGGGGAGQAGTAGGNTPSSGKGGDGVSNSISGSAVIYGGGGGGGDIFGGYYGAGGSGGGGSAAGGAAGNSGTNGLGGGGGGGAYAGVYQNGGNGGSGVVVIRYRTGRAVCTGGTITTSGSDTIHTFTSSGTFSCSSVVATSIVTTPTNITVATANSSAGTAYSVAYGSRNFTLSYNGYTLATATSTASCIAGSTWNGSTCYIAPTGTLSTSDCQITNGNNSCNTNLVWNTSNPSVYVNARVLVIGGGGSGPGGSTANTGPNGGGGGYQYNASYSLSSGSFPVTVGAGATAAGPYGWNGGNSVFGSITAYGGGASSGSGGCGGGGSYDYISGGAGTQGGNGGGGNGSGAGGGGGAGGNGGSGNAVGGVGLSNDISGTATYYAGGGGITGGLGGGGSYPNSGTNGLGGGGSAAGNGGSGVVIIRYPTGHASCTGGTITTVGLDTIHTFTSSGTFACSSVLAVSVVTVPTDVIVASGNSSAGTLYSVPYGSKTFTLSHNLTTLATTTATATCASGTSWTGLICATNPTGNISASNCQISNGESSCNTNLTWNTTNPVQLTLAKVLAVGAGGGRVDSGYTGGGGAGGYVYNTGYPISATSYSVTVGNGVANSNGQNTVFGSITAYGGGVGGANGTSGGSGGSGGGGGANSGPGGIGSQGGNGAAGSGNYSSGGGGGAGGNGYAPTNSSGGVGLSNDISGTATYYAGGGGTYSGLSQGLGGLGGGGSNGVPAVNGLGGGAGWGYYIGGSGIVIIRYPTASATCTGGTITTSGSDTIHAFTSSGTFSCSSTSTISTVTTPTNITVATANSSAGTSYSVAYGSRNFSLVNSNITIATATATATCASGLAWNGSSCVTAPTGTLTASNCDITAGNSSCNTNLVWDTTNPFSTTFPAQALVVAGGGGGGGGESNSAGDAGGGGGGGGVVYNSSISLSPQAYTVTVGTGGNGATGGNGTFGAKGNDSVFNGITAVGGGYGPADENPGGPGGSGGGGGGSCSADKAGGAGTAGQGYSGAIGLYGWCGYRGGAGGGGAGAVGSSNTSNGGGGAGGIGVSNSITGSAVYYGGGGGGGTGRNMGNLGGLGGTGGGGKGGSSPSGIGVSGTANTGGGGGAAGSGISAGGAGGSGIVIVRYPTSVGSCTGGTVTTSGSDTINTFTTSGTLTCTSSNSPSIVTTPTAITVATANSSAGTPYSVAYGSRNFTLSHGGITLATATANASCISPSTIWNGSICVAISLPTVTTQASSSIEFNSSVANGNIDATGGVSNDKRGFVYGTVARGLPGNVAPTSSGYVSYLENNGSYSTGAFTKNLTGLNASTTYYLRAYSHNSLGYSYGGEVSFTTSAYPVMTQSGYRFYNNLDYSDVGNPLAAVNNPASLSNSGEAFRMRLLIHTATSNIPLSAINFKLQYALKSGTCGTYTDVDYTSPISFNLGNFYLNDKAQISANVASDPTNGAFDITPQINVKSNNFTNSKSAIPVNQDGLWDFSLVDNSNSGSSQAYCLRVVREDGATLSGYSVVPEIVVARKVPRHSGSVNVESVGGGAGVGDDTGGQGGGTGATQCSDNIDNDSDGKIDILDDQCHAGGVIGNAYVPTHDSELNAAPGGSAGGGGQGGGGGDIGYFFNRINSIFRLPSLRNILLAMAFNTF